MNKGKGTVTWGPLSPVVLCFRILLLALRSEGFASEGSYF
jgi:hypothetical protein